MPGAEVLLVDDDEDVLRWLAFHLRGQGLEIETASSSNEALERIETDPPELVIADVVMPGMSGYELCKLLRNLGHDELPFIFCSALGSAPERIMGLRMGADDYVTKPIDPEELLLRTRTLLGRSRRLRLLRQQAAAMTSGAVLSGSLGPIGAADLFQLVDLFGLDEGSIHLTLPDRPSGEVWWSGKMLVHAATGRLVGRKAFFRMLGWAGGTFRVECGVFAGTPSMSERLDACLLEGLGQLDECQRLKARFPGRGTALEVRSEGNIGRGGGDDAILALIDAHGDLDRVLDHSPLEDLETLRIVLRLLETGIVGCRGLDAGPGGE